MSEKDKTILVVEDETPLQEAIRIKLEKNKFKVVTSRTVKQALNLLADLEKVDVIWLDHYLLGKEDGLDFIAELKATQDWAAIPVFVVSNTVSPEKIHTYLKLGANKYYTKADYRLDQIIADIRDHLTD